MPHKRKSNLSQSSQKARAMKIARLHESSVHAEQRRLEQALRQAEVRAGETSTQADARRQENAMRIASQRAAETPEQADSRRRENAERIASLRASYTPEEAASRRQEHAQLMASQRAAETPEQADSRRRENAERIASLRASYTPEEAASRRQEHAQLMASQRAAETPEEADSRRRENAERIASLRASDTPEEAASRRREHAQLMASQRASETADEANARRLTVAQRQSERRLIFSRNSWGVFEKCAFEYDATLDYNNHRLIKISRMDKICRNCGALKWKEESAGMCCSGGKVAIPALEEPVDPLKTLFTGETDESRRFLNRVKKYNSCFHMTSFGADRVLAMPGFSPTFTVQGQVHHKIGSLLPPPNGQPQFLQVYFTGNDDAETDRR